MDNNIPYGVKVKIEGGIVIAICHYGDIEQKITFDKDIEEDYAIAKIAETLADCEARYEFKRVKLSLIG